MEGKFLLCHSCGAIKKLIFNLLIFALHIQEMEKQLNEWMNVTEKTSCMLIRIKMHNWPPSKWIIVWNVCWKTRYPQSRKIPPHKRINTSKGKAQRSIIASTLQRHNSANNHYRPRNNLLQMIFISEKTSPPPNISPSTISKPADAQQAPISDPKISNHAQWTVSLLFCCPHYFVLTKQNTLIWGGGGLFSGK